MSAWEKKPALESSGGIGCLCCGTPTLMFPADGWIAVGFGSAGVTRDGTEVYTEPHDLDNDTVWTGADAEKVAAADPDHDWRIHKDAPSIRQSISVTARTNGF